MTQERIRLLFAYFTLLDAYTNANHCYQLSTSEFCSHAQTIQPISALSSSANQLPLVSMYKYHDIFFLSLF